MKAVIFSLMLLLVSGCTTAYKVQGAREKLLFNTAKRNISPNDIRKDVEVYRDTGLAFAGVITASAVTVAGDTLALDLSVEHRYFDWIWDSGGIGDKHYYLSTRGEGSMKISASLKSSVAELVSDKSHLLAEFAPGNMIVFYGKPTGLSEEAIVFDGSYARGFSSSYFGVSDVYYPVRKKNSAIGP